MNRDDLTAKRDRIASLADQTVQSPETVDLLEILEFCGADDQAIRDLAVEALVEVLVSQDIMAELVNQLESVDSELRQEICHTLGVTINQYPDHVVVVSPKCSLRNLFDDDRDAINAYELFGELAAAFPEDIIPILVALLTYDDEDVKSTAVAGLTEVVPEYSVHISPASFPITEALRGGGFLLVTDLMIQYPAEMIPRVVGILTLPEFEEEASKIGPQFNGPPRRSRLVKELQAIDDYERQKQIAATIPFLAHLLTDSATFGDEFTANELSSELGWIDALKEVDVQMPSEQEREKFDSHLLWLIADLLSIVTEAYPAMMDLKSEM